LKFKLRHYNTGHVHGQQHIYAQSVGKLTRTLHGRCFHSSAIQLNLSRL